MKKIRFILIVTLSMAMIFALKVKISFAKFNKPLEIWAVGDCYKVRPDDGKIFNAFVEGKYKKNNFIWDSKNETVSLSGARNEYVAFQIILEAKKDLPEVNISTSDFKGASIIDKDKISLFKEHYTKVKKVSGWPKPSTGIGEYPDALIPFDVADWVVPFSIKEGRNQAVWVDIYIPREAEPGEYTAEFSVSGSNFSHQTLTVKLTVWDFTLPDENHLKAWSNYEFVAKGYGVKKFSEEHYQAERNILKLCHNHGIEALHRHTIIRPKLIRPKSKKATDHKDDFVDIDWRRYDERLGAFLDGSLFDDKQPPSMFLLPINAWRGQRWPKDELQMQRVAKDLVAYFKEKNWDLNRGYIYLWDEPKEEDLPELEKWAKLIKDSAPQLKTTVAFMKYFSPSVVKKLLPYVDLWLVDAERTDLSLFRELKDKGKEVGFYQQGEPWCGNENLDSDGLAFRTWPWIAFKYDIDVIYLYHMTLWQSVHKKGTIWENPRNIKWSNSQGVLLYPGGYINTLEAIPSVRLKQLRRGMQDYEYMYLARKMGKDPLLIVKSIITRALTETHRSGGNHGEWSHNPEEWFVARKKLAYLILGREFKEEIKAEIPTKKSKPVVLYEEGFENGSAEGWEGGVSQRQITYKASKYALKAIAKGKFIYLEKWKKFPINQNTKLSFAYYCKNAKKIIINCWSKRRKRNFSQTIYNPRDEEWTVVTRDLKDFGENIGTSINSIHIAVPNRKEPILVIDNVRLYNE